MTDEEYEERKEEYEYARYEDYKHFYEPELAEKWIGRLEKYCEKQKAIYDDVLDNIRYVLEIPKVIDLNNTSEEYFDKIIQKYSNNS